MGLIVRWILNTLALFLVVTIVPGFHYNSWITLTAAAAVLGIVNAVIKPILFVLTFPLTVITLGLFLAVLNAIMLRITAWIVPSFQIDGWLAAILGALLLSIVSMVTNGIGRKKDER